jgi:hypothetical protein
MYLRSLAFLDQALETLRYGDNGRLGTFAHSPRVDSQNLLHGSYALVHHFES